MNLIGFKSPREDTEFGFVHPVFRTAVSFILVQTSDTLQMFDVERITRNIEGKLNFVSFCEGYDPSKVDYEAFWDGSTLWFAERFKLNGHLSREQRVQMKLNRDKLNTEQGEFLKKSWRAYLLALHR